MGAAKISTTTRRYGKPVTLIKGLNFEGLTKEKIEELIKILKTSCACGGTYDKENKQIELQGNHKDKVKGILVKNGFKVEGYDRNKESNRGKD
jgi:translation initiation factor 1